MKFTALTSAADPSLLKAEYAAAWAVGQLRMGEERIFFRAGLRVYYMPYGDVKRYFRRVEQVPARLCCGRGNFEIENLVLCGDSGELAQIQLPGARAAKMVMERMAQRAPEAAVGRPGSGASAHGA